MEEKNNKVEMAVRHQRADAHLRIDFRSNSITCCGKIFRHNPNALSMMIVGFFFWSVLLSSVAYGMKLIGLSFQF